MSYVLVYGFRRYSACKKLGWKKVPCFIKETDKTLELDVDKIEILVENTRLNQDDDSFHELMQSIKENGLLQPIGVSNSETFSKEEFITTNLIENIHRQNISPVELSHACRKLREEGLTTGQIAIRLSQPKGRIENLLNISKDMQEELNSAIFIGEHKKERKGKLPFAILSRISSFRASNEDRKLLLQTAKENELTVRDITLLIKLHGSGMSIKEAIEKLSEFIFTTLSVIINKKELEKRDFKDNHHKWINQILRAAEPKLFYYTEKKIQNDT